MSVFSVLPSVSDGLSGEQVTVIRELFGVWESKRERNILRSVYYDGLSPLKDFGISIPPQMKNIRLAMDWPEKTVRELAKRNMFDGFVLPGVEGTPFDLGGVLSANRFNLEFKQGVISAYKHSCAFITVAKGDVSAGEPEVVVQIRSAEWSAGLWDKRRREMSAALAITDTTDGAVTGFTAYLPGLVVTCERSNGRWFVDQQVTGVRRVLVEPLTYDPQLDRPFGRSRITRRVMTLTDQAVRSMVRAEVAAEFFAAPQRYVLGHDNSAEFDTWKAVTGRLLAISKDEDGDAPTVGQFPQMSMQPHMEMYRSLSGQFAGSTGVPLNALGIVADNPASAEAIYAAELSLTMEARDSNEVFRTALERTAQNIVMLRDGLSEPSDELLALQARFVPPEIASPVSSADALIKLSAVFPWLADSPVALERAGFSRPEIDRLLADKKSAELRANVAGLVAAFEGTTKPDGGVGESAGAADESVLEDELKNAQILKTKLDAIGVARRAGVNAASAADLVGLQGIKFDPGTPITLKQPGE